ncbi:hypothetical protein BX616_011018 [Lobosporangium transversale]|uniref:Mitochondrial carrier domain-containing protein n=1 Tax=Lobosporangium transversale TaxID=64571 RepID=A0A1Y2H376_9FUNG|nr:mitochondrial carrier domain-containing protein [Lobosporangium transversale]KAF9917879.1 hypothetical protein BX616_011018 [Lobosporangium transversale]ORZ29009.1 mitochondrial carrier domain-containing protein [Lobosporangium transversale]|eukprot:XP_021886682.1 mitochondrial carrier domain-containing protein [Lobosporangium transversale]
MTSPFNYPPPGGAPNANSTLSPLRPFYGTQLDSPLQSYYQHTAQLEHDLANTHEVDPDSQAATKELLRYGLLKYFTLALASPFEVAQILMQVEYSPTDERDDTVNDCLDTAEQERYDEEFRRAQEAAEEEEFFENESESDGYYSNSAHTGHFPSPRSNVNKLDPNSAVFKERKLFDQSGYLIRDDVYDEDLRPAFQLAPINGGVYSVMKALFNHPTEGLFSLWKGQYTNWLYEILHLFAQPTLEATLNDTFDLYDDAIPLVHLDRVGPNIATLVASHVVVGFILSPLELVRTRLIVQTADPKQRKYTSMLNCISTIISEEGFTALWGGVNLLPTLLYHTINPLLTNCIPLVIDRVFKISAEDSPSLYSVAELGLEVLDLLIRSPLETVRRRLQIQIQAKIPGKRYETVVETRKRPYSGIKDCLYKIVQEEGGKPRRRRRSRKQIEDGDEADKPKIPWYGVWRVRRLYTGLGMFLTGNLVMFAVSTTSNLNTESLEDW